MASKDSSRGKKRSSHADLLRLAEDRAEGGRRPPPTSGHPALSLLLVGRWDDAFGILHQLSEETIGAERAQRLLDKCGDRVAVQEEIRETIEALYARGTREAGELALAWSMMTCRPSYPPRFRSVLPQLQYALDQADLDANDDGDCRDRLRIWWAAGAGEYVREKRSPFALAAAVLAGEIVKESALGETVPMRDEAVIAKWFSSPHPGPTKVVMPAATAAKLVSNTKQFEAILDKPLPLVVGRDLATAQRRLGYEFPHATSALSVLFKDLRESEPVRLRPTILLGPSGCGKSRIARKWAAAVGLHVQMVDGASSGDNHFGGTSRSWSTSEPSVPARAVLASRTANPLVVIEEIDKAKAGVASVNGSLYNALALYLETESAARVRDPSLDAVLDLASVSYICTANAAELPDFLRDRFRIVKVPAPRLVDLPLLAASIVDAMLFEEGDEWAGSVAPFAPDELTVMAKAWAPSGFSMRKLQKIVAATLEARDACQMRH